MSSDVVQGTLPGRVYLVGAGQKSHDWARSSRAADTLALYMAAGDAEGTLQQLTAAGWSGDTAIALVESASLPDSRSWRGTLAELPRLAGALGSGPVMLLAGAALTQRAGCLSPPMWPGESATEAVNEI